MSTRTIWIAVTALAVAGIVAVFWNRSARENKIPEPKTPGIERPGVKMPKELQRPTKLKIAGEVLDEAGMPVKGATVYVLDKKRPGADRDKIDHEVSDANGRWQLRTRKTVGCWIGVVAPGYRTALLDGDGVDPTKKIIHVVTRSPALEVTVVDEDGKPVPEAGLQLAPWPPGGTYFCPGPLCRQGEQWAVTDEDGRCTFRQDVAAPVVITPFRDGWHGHPGSIWLPDASGTAKIVLHPNASLELTLTSEGAPLDTQDLITLEFLDGTRGTTAFAFTESLAREGLLRLERTVVPGTYDVAVSVPGRPPVVLRGVVIPDEGDRTARLSAEIPTERAKAAGTLVVVLEGNKPNRPIKGRRRAPLSFLQRIDEGALLSGWQPGAPERFEAARQRLVYELKPGTYRLLVADVLTGRAAQEAAIEVEPGKQTKLTLPMALGQYGKVPAVQDGEIYVRALEAREVGGGGLPVFGSSRNGRQRFSRGIDLIARKVRGEDVVIGPYPLDEFEVVLRRSDGSTKTAAYR